jgi:hypothetical protein
MKKNLATEPHPKDVLTATGELILYKPWWTPKRKAILLWWAIVAFFLAVSLLGAWAHHWQ